MWEQIYNPHFKVFESEHFKKQAGLLTFTPSVSEWINKTDAIGLCVKRGKYGGTYAHKDIAFEFASWLSPEFKLYIIKDYQRLKEDESHRLSLDWNVKRIMAKANYRIHTDSIKENLIPNDLPKNRQGFTYADEADVLNIALFGMTAKQWREKNSNLKGNMRDYATIEQLLVMANLESTNALLIQQKMPQQERLYKLREIAISQLESLTNNKSVQDLISLHATPRLPNT